jgi:hypothetical protein
MRLAVGLLGTVLLVGTAGCEMEGGYGGGYAMYGEYPYTYYGGAVSPGYVYPYPYAGWAPYDRDHYWDRDRYWEGNRWHGDRGWGRDRH